MTSSLRIRIIRGGEISGGATFIMTALPSPSLPDSPFLQLRLTEYTVLPSCCTTRRPRWSIAGARNICTRYLSVSLPRPKYLHPSSPATRSSLPDATYLRFGAAGQSRPRTHVPALSGPILQHVLTGEGNVRNQTRVRRPVSARSLRCAALRNPTYTYGAVSSCCVQSETSLTSAPSIAIAIRFPASRASLSLATPRPAHQHQSFHLPSKHLMTLPR